MADPIRYRANAGLNYPKAKAGGDEVRVEADELVPATCPEKYIKAFIAQDSIREDD